MDFSIQVLSSGSWPFQQSCVCLAVGGKDGSSSVPLVLGRDEEEPLHAGMPAKAFLLARQSAQGALSTGRRGVRRWHLRSHSVVVYSQKVGPRSSVMNVMVIPTCLELETFNCTQMRKFF